MTFHNHLFPLLKNWWLYYNKLFYLPFESVTFLNLQHLSRSFCDAPFVHVLDDLLTATGRRALVSTDSELRADLRAFLFTLLGFILCSLMHCLPLGGKRSCLP